MIFSCLLRTATRNALFLCRLLLVAGVICVATGNQSAAQYISTVAGTGVNGFSGDGGLATSAQLNYPAGVVVDASGNLYIADTGSRRIRKVNASTGVISTVAGTGVAGFSGDGGLATSAQVYSPSDVAVDASGNLYIADYANGRIRKVDASTGNIGTVAGGGGVYVDGGPATSAQLGPRGVAVDASGNLYIADEESNRIRKVMASTGNISTVAGIGGGSGGFSGDGGLATNAQLDNVRGVALDAAGNLYIADRDNRRIRKVDASTGNISTVAGTGTPGFSGDGGPATSAQLLFPNAVAFDAAGNLYISDSAPHSIRKVDASTGNISTVAGTGVGGFSGDGGPATSAQLNGPNGMALDASGNLYIADINNNRIRRFNSLPETTPAVGLSGASTTAAGSEVAVLTVGLTGDGVASLTSIALTLADLSAATGLSTGDFSQLRLYRNSSASLSGATQIGTQNTVNVGSATTVSATTPDTPPASTQRFYLVTAVLSGSATGGHAFKVGFARGGVSTSATSVGTAVTASDANKVTVLSVTETATAVGLSGATTAAPGGEVLVLAIGLTGEGLSTLNSVGVTLSDLSSATGLVVGDFSQLRLYRNSSASLSGATQIGSQGTVNVGSATTITPTSTETVAASQRYYLVTAVLSNSAVGGHAFRAGFTTGGVSTSATSVGTVVTASDANKVTVVSVTETVAAAGLSGATTAAPGGEVVVLAIGLTGDGLSTLTSVGVTLSDLSSATGLAVGDFSQLRLYRNSSTSLSGATQIGSQGTVNVGSVTTVTPTSTETMAASQKYYLVTAVLNNSAVGGHAFRAGFATGGVSTSATSVGTVVTASDANKVTVVSVMETVAVAGLSGATTAAPGGEVVVLSVGLTGDGLSTLTSVGVMLSDLSSATGLTAGDFTALRLYRNSSTSLSGATQIGSQGTVNIGSATTITPTSTETVAASQRYYLVTAVLSNSAVGGHAFRAGFTTGGVSTSATSVGTAVTASDANKVTVVSVTETAVATGLSGGLTAVPGAEVLVLTIGLIGDGLSTLTSVGVMLSDLSSATGLAAGDFSQLRLYRNSSASLSGATQIGSQGTVNIGSATTLTPLTTEILGLSQRYYLVTAVLSNSVTIGGHLFKVGFAAGGVSTSATSVGTAVNAADANYIRMGQPILSLPNAASVGNVVWGVSGTGTFTVSNTGTSVLAVTSITSSDNRLAVSPTSFSVAAGSSQNVTVTFTPMGLGSVSANLTVNSSMVSSQVLPVSATGVSGTVTDFTLAYASAVISKGGFEVAASFFNAYNKQVPYTGKVTLSAPVGGFSGTGTQNASVVSSLVFPLQADERRGDGSASPVSFIVNVEGVGSKSGSFQLISHHIIPSLATPVVEVRRGDGSWVGFSAFAFVGGRTEHLRVRHASPVPAKVSLDISYDRVQENGQKGPAVLLGLEERLAPNVSREFDLTLPLYMDVAGGSAPLRLWCSTAEGPSRTQPDGEAVRYQDATNSGAVQATFAAASAISVVIGEWTAVYGAKLHLGVLFDGETQPRCTYGYDARRASGSAGSSRFENDLIVRVDQGSPLRVVRDGSLSHLGPAQANELEVLSVEQATATVTLQLGPLEWTHTMAIDAMGNAPPTLRLVRAEALKPQPGNLMQKTWQTAQRLPRKTPVRLVLAASDPDAVLAGLAEVGLMFAGQVVAYQQFDRTPREAEVVLDLPLGLLDSQQEEVALQAYALDVRGARSETVEGMTLGLSLQVEGVEFSPWSEGQNVQVLEGRKPGERLIAIGVRVSLDRKGNSQLLVSDAARVAVRFDDGSTAPPDNYQTQGGLVQTERGEDGTVRMVVRGLWDPKARTRTRWLKRYAQLGLVESPTLGRYLAADGTLWRDYLFPYVEQVSTAAAKRVEMGPGALEELRQQMLAVVAQLPEEEGEEWTPTPALQLPEEFGFLANYPNPFNPQTQIVYRVEEAGPVRLAVIDLLGQEVRVLDEEWRAEGVYGVEWDGRDAGGRQLASGVYFCRMEAGEQRTVGRMLLLR